jgi:hypothetical protein
MSKDESEAQQDSAPDDGATFAKDAQGRTIYYPNGSAWSGYVMTDRERALRDVIKRRNDSRWSYLGLVLWFPFVVGFCFLFQTNIFEAFALLLLVPALLLFMFGWIRDRWWNRELVSGLERIGPDNMASCRLLVLGLTGATMAVLIWLIFHLYQQRIDVIPRKGSIAEFFPNISIPLFMTWIFGLAALALLFHWQKAVDRLGEVRTTFTALFVVVFGFASFAWTWTIFFSPEPRVVLTGVELYCGSWIKWADIKAVTVSYGRRGKEYARLHFDSPSSDPGFTPLLFRTDNSESCETTGLTVDSSTVFNAIRDTWQDRLSQRNTAAAQNAVVAPAGPRPVHADRTRPTQPNPVQDMVATGYSAPFKQATAPGPVSIGQRRADVIAELGTPFEVATASGKTLYYILPHEQISLPLPETQRERHLIAVHFGTPDLVTGVDTYDLRDGRVQNDIPPASYTDSPDVHLLIAMGFWPHSSPR